jgi:hypothetical protein
MKQLGKGVQTFRVLDGTLFGEKSRNWTETAAASCTEGRQKPQHLDRRWHEESGAKYSIGLEGLKTLTICDSAPFAKPTGKMWQRGC